jgi:pantetheine-phosphate adenylyltransferase
MIAILPGTFDPPTLGHIDIIKRSINLCDKLIIAIGNSDKACLFSVQERIEQLISCTPSNVEIKSFSGLLVDFAKENKSELIIRGIRNSNDYEYKFNISTINYKLAGIETIFLNCKPELAVISSSMLKQIAKLGGDISSFTTRHIAHKVRRKFEVGTDRAG